MLWSILYLYIKKVTKLKIMVIILINNMITAHMLTFVVRSAGDVEPLTTAT